MKSKCWSICSILQVGHSQLACGSCGPEEYCSYSNGHPRCEKCTVCPPGFFLVAQCSVHADRICQVSILIFRSIEADNLKLWKK